MYIFEQLKAIRLLYKRGIKTQLEKYRRKNQFPYRDQVILKKKMDFADSMLA